VFVAVEQEGRIGSPGQLNVKTRSPLNILDFQ